MIFPPLTWSFWKRADGADGYRSFPVFPTNCSSPTMTSQAKGMLSKREVRLTILSLLSPRAGEVGWDVGAGCGGVSVEWARWNPHGTVYAVECHEERLRCLTANRERFGVLNNLHIIAGQAPEALVGVARPRCGVHRRQQG